MTISDMWMIVNANAERLGYEVAIHSVMARGRIPINPVIPAMVPNSVGFGGMNL